MTNRAKYNIIWAQDGTAIDPDLDTTQPLYIPNRYTQVGWKAEKPPEYWQNFLQQINDLKILEALVNGILNYDTTVTYQSGSITSATGKLYIQSGTGTSQEIMDLTASGYNAKMDSTTSIFNNHNVVGNKHDDNIKTTIIGGGYYKSEVDAFFNSPTDPKTIVYHMNRSGAIAHNETPAQVGVLAAAAGGTFTGDVFFNSDVVLQTSPNKRLHFASELGYLQLVFGSYSIGVDGAGNVWFVSPTGTYLCATIANYGSFEMAVGQDFALPPPLISINLESSIHDVMSFGNWTVTTASDPVFELGKGFKVSGNATSITSISVAVNFTLHVVGWDDTAGTSLVKTVDISANKTYATIAAILSAAGATTMTHVKYIRFYPRLTAYQKTTLVI